jgi:hypothetical protein
VRLRTVGIALALVCCSETHDGRWRDAAAIAGAAELVPRVVEAQRLPILSFERTGPPDRILTIYIEGDGRAWINPWQAASDPTPTDPVGLRLAAADPAQPLVYFARPCQYLAPAGCVQRLWTDARLSPEIVDLYQSALDDALRRTGSRRLGLVGYSGGGALATLVAERRHDVAWLVTIAANLDLAEWTRLEELAPMRQSLDPAADTSAIRALTQRHLVGADDRVVPPAVVQSFLRHLPASGAARMTVIDGFDHVCCWADAWPRLLRGLDLPR